MNEFSSIGSAKKILMEIEKAIVGKNEVMIKVLLAILAGGHILMEDIPGVGKTTMALSFSRALGLDYSRVQFTPDVLPSDITGYSVFDKSSGKMLYQKGAILSNLFLADELNRATSRTQSALLQAMEEGAVTVDNQTYPVPQPFIVIATQNPGEQEGTHKLPEAQLDRFLMKITVGYPSVDDEVQIMERHQAGNISVKLENVQPILTKDELLKFRKLVDEIYLDKSLLRYIAEIIQQTRVSKSVFLGASPRASIAIMQSSKAYAMLQGRDFVTPEDIKFVAPYVLQHRIQLDAEAEMEGLGVVTVIKRLIDKVEVPK